MKDCIGISKIIQDLYKSMSGGDMFQVEISESLDECAKYLSVDKKLLQNEII
jgi:hypothetical protein